MAESRSSCSLSAVGSRKSPANDSRLPTWNRGLESNFATMRHDLMQLIRSTRHVRTGLTVAGCLVLAVPARAQGRAAQPVGADSALLQRMLEVEDARVSDSASLAPILAGLKSPDVTTRRIAVRGIGRMERIDNVAFIQSLVTDPSPVIRAEALNAIAQILKGDAATAG